MKTKTEVSAVADAAMNAEQVERIEQHRAYLRGVEDALRWVTGDATTDDMRILADSVGI